MGWKIATVVLAVILLIGFGIIRIDGSSLRFGAPTQTLATAHAPAIERPSFKGLTTVFDERPALSADRHCVVPGTVYVAEANACVLRITDIRQIQAVVPDRDNDPDCEGKPDGFKFDRKVTGPDGREGIAHMVCGRR